MRVAMVIDEQRLAQEQRLLNRLGVGLMAEGVHLVRIVPEGLPEQALDEGERRIALASRITTPMKALPWTRGARVRRLLEALEDAPPDVLYLVGSATWSVGLDLAAALDRPALIDVSSPAQVAAAPKPEAQPYVAAYVAPCEGIAAQAIARFGKSMVSIAPMGVSTTRRPRNVLSHPDRPPAIAILGEARDMPAYSALLGGLSVVLKEHPALEVFIELRGPHEHDIWRQAERQALFGSISAIGSATQHRPLLMRCDVLLWPEHHGGLRSLLLEAMAAAIPVIASHDAALDMLRDGETARLVHRDDAEAWAEHLAGLLREPEQARALGRGGREHVVSHHQSSKQVLALLETLERVSGRAYAFPTGGARL